MATKLTGKNRISLVSIRRPSLTLFLLAQKIVLPLATLLAAGCGGVTHVKTSSMLPLSDRPIIFVGSIREVSLIPKTVAWSLECASDARDGLGLLRPQAALPVVSNSCGCEHASFSVSRWITPPTQHDPDVTLGFSSSEWCRPITPIVSTPLLVVWDDDRGEPDMLVLWELHPGRWFFAPRSTTLAGIELGPLLVDELIDAQWEVGDESDRASLQMITDLGACKRGENWAQCRSVPLDGFISALRSSRPAPRGP